MKSRLPSFAGNLRWIAFGALSAAALWAQGNSGQANRPNSAGDEEWTRLASLNNAAKAPSSKSAGGKFLVKTPAEVKADQLARALAYRSLAQAAKEFAAQFPAHPSAPVARKLEALAGISGIAADDSTHEQVALKVANDYRVDRKNRPTDRFEVAHVVERHQIGRKLGGRHYLTSPVEAEKMADRLRKEFGGLPEVYGLYLSVAQNTNCDNGADVARKILQLPAPPAIKAAARQVVERRALLGKSFEFPLTRPDGVATTLSRVAGQRTVVCVWPGDKQPAGPPGLHLFKQSAAPGIQWVYVSLGSLPAASTIGVKHAKPAGTTFEEPLGLKSPLATRLKITQLPCVYVFDEQKRLTGFGRIEDLPALLSQTRRLIEP